MSITVILPSALVDHAGGQRSLDLAQPDGMTVEALLDALAVEHPAVVRCIRDETGAVRPHVNVFIDGDECRSVGGISAHVPEDAVVHVIPSVSGG